MKTINDIFWKVYSDDPETECWAEEYLNEIKQSNEYKEYVRYIELQIEEQQNEDMRYDILQEEFRKLTGN
jgi:hypothetical protein